MKMSVNKIVIKDLPLVDVNCIAGGAVVANDKIVLDTCQGTWF